MGTTLTGTKPKDTYDSLIKVEDNGPISGTAKYLSDGLGNNLPIAVSTSNVGIGTSAPEGKLEILGGTSTTNTIIVGKTDNATIASDHSIVFNVDRNLAVGGRVVEFRYGGNGYGGGTPVARFTSAGLCFGNDYAAANALDDYEEGTWTPASSSLTLNFTTTTANGHYTKIGNQVTVTWEIAWTSVNVGPAGTTFISNLPFTSKAGSFATAPIWIESTAAGQQFFVYNDPSSTSLYVAFHSGGAASSNAPASIWGATNRFFGSITYLV